MRTFHLQPLIAAIVFSLLAMGCIGLFVVLPVILINFAWNALIPPNTALPAINILQASLLYVAGMIGLYLTGLVKIEIKAEKLE